MRILLLVLTLAITGCPDPDPECPEGCEGIVGLEGYIESCSCPPGFFDEYCPERDERLEEDCEDL